MSFGSVFQSVGVVKEKERSPYYLVLTDGMLSIRMSAEDRSCLEGVGSSGLTHALDQN